MLWSVWWCAKCVGCLCGGVWDSDVQVGGVRRGEVCGVGVG